MPKRPNVVEKLPEHAQARAIEMYETGYPARYILACLQEEFPTGLESHIDHNTLRYQLSRITRQKRALPYSVAYMIDHPEIVDTIIRLTKQNETIWTIHKRVHLLYNLPFRDWSTLAKAMDHLGVKYIKKERS